MFGDRCNYAHGEAELRPLNQEGQDILAKRAERELREQQGRPQHRSAGGERERERERETAGLYCSLLPPLQLQQVV